MTAVSSGARAGTNITVTWSSFTRHIKVAMGVSILASRCSAKASNSARAVRPATTRSLTTSATEASGRASWP